MIKPFCHLSEWHQASHSDNFIVCPALFEWPCHFATHWLSQDVDTDPHTKSTISLIYCDPHKDHKYPLIPRRTFQRPAKPPNPALPLAKALIGLPETLQKDLNQPRRLITPHDCPMILTITSVLCCDALRPRGHPYDPKRPLGSPSRPRQLTDHMWTSKTSRFTKTSL